MTPSLFDLFGPVPPPSSTADTTAAEWPAAGASRPLSRPAAVDRPSRSGGSLTGTYTRVGANLRRGDGRALVVCLSTDSATARRPARYVRTVAAGEAIRYVGSLYADEATGRDDLDGCQFQDGTTGTRYALRLDVPDRYLVAAIASRRGRVSP